ncbi:LPD38 domain-containing protein [Pseudomonas sp. JH-2]|uniref:LPD38 domain-containing protein n=1 Tax=Pseudomonas sp. JH-2 TaxID=3114998 RepID=UPI002E253AE5|nr:LPD38 domain-containing protein [Pseudomonas sp. JH-2]
MSDLLQEFGLDAGSSTGRAGAPPSATPSQQPDLVSEFGLNAPERPSISGEFSKGIGAGVDSLQGTLYGLAGLAGDAAGAEGLRDWGLEGYQRNQQEATESAPAVGRFEDVHGAHDAALYAAQGLGQLVPFAASSVATGGIGGAVAKVAGRKAVERFAENQVAKGVARATAEKAAKAYGNKLAERGAMAGVAANSVGTEQGSIYGDIYDKTGQYAPGTAAAYGAAAGALDALPEVGLISRLAGRGTGGIARQTLKQAGAEGATEGAQTAVENLAVQRVDPNHHAFDQQGVSDIANASLIGALGGGVAGGGAAAAGRLRKPSEQMGLDPNAGPLSAAATVAVDGRVAHEVQRAALLNNAPAPAESGLREQDLADLPTAVAQQMFRTEADPDNPGALRYFRQDPDLQREVEVPEQDALAAAQQRIAVAQQQGLDPLDSRGLEELLPQVDEETGPPAERGTGMAADDLTPYERNQLRALGVTDEQLATMTTEQARGVPLPQVDFESGPGQVESVAEQPPLPTVEMDTGPMEAEQVAAAPVSGDPDFEFRVQKNGRPFKSERDVRLLRTLEEATQAGEQPVVVPHEGGFAVAVRRPPAPTLALPAPDTLVVDRQGNAQRGPVAPFVTPERQRALPGGPGMDQQARPGQRPTIEALLPGLRQRAAAGEQLDTAAIAQQTGASRAIAARAVQGVQAEQQAMAKPYTNRLQAGRALGRLPAPAAFEVVQRGSRDFRIQPKAQPEVEDAGNRAGPGDEREAGAAAAVPARPTDVAPVPAAEPGAGQPAGGRASARADRPAAEPAAERSPAVAPKEPLAPESSKPPSRADEQGDLPDILAMPRRRYIANQAKQEGLKKGSPGYGQAIQRLEDRYEADLDAASAGLSFERYNALNSDSPASVNRQAWEALRAEYGRYSQASYRASAPVLKGLRASQLQRALQERISHWRNAPDVRVVQSVDDLPPRLRQRVQRDGAEGVEGIFDGGAVYLVADNIGSYQHGGFVLAHEVLGHAGLQGLFGRRLEPLLHSIYRGNDQVRAAADRLAEQTGYRRPVAVEEVLADLAAAGSLQQQGFWPRLVSAVRAGLRAIGLDMKWTDGDLARLLANARGFIEGGAGRAAGEARYSRRGWDASFPDVAVAHPLAFLNNHPDYAAAKAGDTAAALRVARDAITPEFVEQVRQAIPAGSSPKIVPVVAREGAGNNRIPVIAAEVLAQRLGLQTDLNPVQQEKIGRTSASALERVTRQPTFQGEVAPGDYILLDDTLTQGGTLAQLKTHIEDNGGRVVLATALTGKNYSRKLSLDSSTLAEVRGKYGSIEPWFRETFGYGFEGLTQSEARTILTFDRGGLSPEQLRDRLAASRDARGSGVGQGATGDRSGTQAPVGDDDQGPRYSRAGQRTLTLLDQVANRGPVKFADHVTDAQRDALSKIGAFARKETIAETAAKYRDRWKEKFIQGVFDQFAPIAKLDQTAYMQARLSKGTDGALESIFLYGKPKLLDGALAVDPDGHGLRGVLAKLRGEHDLFFAWMAGHRAERLAAEGRENLFTAENIRELKRLNQGTMEGGGSRTLAYAQAQKEFAAYQRSVLDVAEKAGLIDPGARKLWENEFYVPFYRVMEEGDGTAGPGQIGGLTGQRAFQKLKGGKEPLGDLMANTLANWSHLLTASMKNLAATNALKAAEPMGVATPVREAEKGAVRVMMGGREQHYLVHDPLVLDALTMLHQQDWNNPAMKAMRAFKHWLTTGVTSSPAFRARNLLRDSISAVATNDLGYNPLKNVAEGWRGTAHSSPVMQQLIAGGGAVRFGALNDGDQAAHAKRLIKDLGAKEGQILTTQEKITRALRSAWDRYQELGDRLESVNRATLYKKLREQGRSHLEASYLARDMMDFTSAGKWASVRFLTQIVPFMNARLQGMYKLGRGAGTDPRRFLAVAGAVAMVSVLLHLLNKDDDEYKELPDFVRNNYWWVRLPGAEHALYIPKPFEVGVLGSVAERMTELATAGNDYRAGDFASTLGALLTDQLQMSPVPQAFKPAMDAIFNYDSFRKTAIDSMGQERLPPAERYTSSTSAAAVAAGRLANISPQRLEHLVRGYFGWLGTQALNAGDYMLRGPMDLPANPRRDATNPDNWTLYGDFVKPVAGGSSKYLDRFYEMQHQIDQLYASASEARKVDDLGRLEELAGNSTLKLRPIYNAANRRITAINQRMRAVSNDPTLGAEEKMALLRELSESRNQVARRVDERARAAQ